MKSSKISNNDNTPVIIVRKPLKVEPQDLTAFNNFRRNGSEIISLYSFLSIDQKYGKDIEPVLDKDSFQGITDMCLTDFGGCRFGGDTIFDQVKLDDCIWLNSKFEGTEYEFDPINRNVFYYQTTIEELEAYLKAIQDETDRFEGSLTQYLENLLKGKYPSHIKIRADLSKITEIDGDIIKLDGADLSNVRANGIFFRNIKVKNFVMRDANLNKACFENSIIEEGDFRGTALYFIEGELTLIKTKFSLGSIKELENNYSIKSFNAWLEDRNYYGHFNIIQPIPDPCYSYNQYLGLKDIPDLIPVTKNSIEYFLSPENKCLDFRKFLSTRGDFKEALIKKYPDLNEQLLTTRNLIEFLAQKGKEIIPDLSRVNFSGRNLTNRIFKRCNLAGANFHNANLKGCDFTGSNLAHAKLTGTKDEYLQMEGVILDYCNLDFATLNFFNGKNSSIQDVQVRRASINAGNLNNSNIRGSDFSYSKLILIEAKELIANNVNAKSISIIDCNLSDIEAQFSIFDYAKIQHTYLAEADFKGSSLEGTELSSGTNLHNTNLESTRCGIIAPNNDLSEVKMDRANITSKFLGNSTKAKKAPLETAVPSVKRQESKEEIPKTQQNDSTLFLKFLENFLSPELFNHIGSIYEKSKQAYNNLKISVPILIITTIFAAGIIYGMFNTLLPISIALIATLMSSPVIIPMSVIATVCLTDMVISYIEQHIEQKSAIPILVEVVDKSELSVQKEACNLKNPVTKQKDSVTQRKIPVTESRMSGR